MYAKTRFVKVEIDRLTHHCEIIETEIESWRFKNRSLG